MRSCHGIFKCISTSAKAKDVARYFPQGSETSVTNFDFNFEPTVAEPHRIAWHGLVRLGTAASLGIAASTQRGCHIEMPIKLPGTSMIRGPKHFFGGVTRASSAPNSSNTWRTPNAYTKYKLTEILRRSRSWRRCQCWSGRSYSEICATQWTVLNAD